jgi:hypothetical protein
MSWVICCVCRGDGTHVNPAIDANGLDRESMADLDFMDNYMSGVYDRPCQNCGGSGKVQESYPGENQDHLNTAAEDRKMAALEDGDVEGYFTAHDWRWG